METVSAQIKALHEIKALVAPLTQQGEDRIWRTAEKVLEIANAAILADCGASDPVRSEMISVLENVLATQRMHPGKSTSLHIKKVGVAARVEAVLAKAAPTQPVKED